MYIAFCTCPDCSLVTYPSSETALKRRMRMVLMSAQKEFPGAFCSCPLPALGKRTCGGCIAGHMSDSEFLALLKAIADSPLTKGLFVRSFLGPGEDLH